MSEEFMLLVIWLSIETAFNCIFLGVDVWLRMKKGK